MIQISISLRKRLPVIRKQSRSHFDASLKSGEIRIFREGNATSISSHHLHEKSDFFQCTVNIATVNRWVKLFRANIITSQAMPLLNKHRKCTQIKEIIYQKRRSPNVNWIGWYNHSNYGLKPPVKITKGNQF